MREVLLQSLDSEKPCLVPSPGAIGSQSVFGTGTMHPLRIFRWYGFGMCEACGYAGPESCQAALDELMLWSLSQPRPPFIHQVVVDTYAAQHLEPDTVSPIQQHFALFGLCLVVEREATGLFVQQEHMRIAKLPGRTDWPEIPNLRPTFSMHVGDVVASPDWEAAVQVWAQKTWAAWEPAHETVYEFIELTRRR